MLSILKGVGAFLALSGACFCRLTDKNLNTVTEYIDMLHSLTPHHTIYSLFDVDRWAKDSTLKKKRSLLLNECYKLKKKGKYLFGDKVDHTQERNLIINGYKILTNKELKEAYLWVVNEAPPGFIEEYRRRAEKNKASFKMPSFFVIFIFVVIMWGMSDLLCTFLPQMLAKPEIRNKKKEKREKKKGIEPAHAKKKTLQDTVTCRIALGVLESLHLASVKNK